MSCDPEWDEEVDVVCTDSGLAGLATAISATDEDAEVFLADAVDSLGAVLHGPQSGWFAFGDDEANAEYRSELTADVDIAAFAQSDADLPVRLSGELVPVRRRPRPPFEGARLTDWTARCVAAPTGYLYTQVTDWTSEMMDCGAGDFVKVTEIGSMTPELHDPAASVEDWLRAEALDRGVSAHPVRRFERLVFEEGAVVGAVFSTDSGPLAVRAHHGVLICRKAAAAGDDFYRRLPADSVLRVALVGKDASRFGRVELLTTDSTLAEVAVPAPRAAADALTTSRS